MQRIKWALMCAISGATIFWTPDIIVHAVIRDWGRVSIILTFLLPLITIAGFGVIRKLGSKMISPASIPVLMLIGIWIFGPLFMTVGWSFYGDEFSNVETWQSIWLGMSFFPMYTYMMSGYDGTVFALLLATLCLVLLSLASKLGWFKKQDVTSVPGEEIT